MKRRYPLPNEPETRAGLERSLEWKRDILKHANGEYAEQLEDDIKWLERRLAETP